MSQYKKTLNLPKTSFPMKANLPNREPNILKHWAEINLYHRLREERKDAPLYVMHDGPPYASGRPHMGTAMNKTIKDIVAKSRGFAGFNAPLVPGWDCHGLPIELNVEKKFGKPGRKLNEAEFRKECRKFAEKQVAIQREDFQRLGVLADWDNPYLTMDFCYEADSIRALAQITEKGYLQRGFKPVHWCSACGSALAEAEVEYMDKTSPALDVGFPVVDASDLAARLSLESVPVPVWLPIWTTTPWTLPANQMVCLHPESLYVLVDVGDKSLVIAKELMAPVLARYGLEDCTVIKEFEGAYLAGVILQHPFQDRQVPVAMGEHVTTDAGTGAVHTAGAHGLDDYAMCRQEGMEILSCVDARGVYNDDVPDFAGQHIYKANEPIIEKINEVGLLLKHEPLQHSYPHCWRHKTPLFFRATPQWFIAMDEHNLRHHACEQIKASKWIPAWGEQRIEGMVAGRPDWCVSRQRFWGTPIAIFVDRQTHLPHPDSPRLMEEVAKRVEKSGIQAWYDLDPTELLGDEAEQYEKITDVMDVWFDSGVSHYTVLQQREELQVPADLYFEGSDQHRGWFQSSLLTSVAMRGIAPFKTVLTHGYVVDGQGRKMSKSLGNGMFPADVVKKLGADVLRLWAASADHTDDLNVSDEILQRTGDAYRRIRNTTRFLLGNLHDFTDSDAVAFDKLIAIDYWMLQQVQSLHEQIVAAYESFQLQRIYQLLHNFCSVTLGSFYLDVLKDRLYTAAKAGFARRSAQTAMSVVLDYFVCWLAPILSFTAEEIWQAMPGDRADSIFLTRWPTRCEGLSASQSSMDWDRLMQLRDGVNKALESVRTAGTIGSGLDAAVTVYVNDSDYALLQALDEELRFLLITSQAAVAKLSDKADDAVVVSDELTVSVEPIATEKCERCWQRRPDQGENAEHPTLCGRCVENVTNPAGEERRWV
jgi:isoleucyl-tRNA synthetase